jgi:hypothetical protein
MTDGSGVTVTEIWGRCQFWTDQIVWSSLDFKVNSKGNMVNI